MQNEDGDNWHRWLTAEGFIAMFHYQYTQRNEGKKTEENRWAPSSDDMHYDRYTTDMYKPVHA